MESNLQQTSSEIRRTIESPLPRGDTYYTPASSIVLQQMLSCSNKHHGASASVIVPQQALLCSSKSYCAPESVIVLQQVLLCPSKCYCVPARVAVPVVAASARVFCVKAIPIASYEIAPSPT